MTTVPLLLRGERGPEHTRKTWQIAEMVRDRPDLAYDQIAARFDISRARVGAIARMAGLTPRRRADARPRHVFICSLCGASRETTSAQEARRGACASHAIERIA